MEKIQEKLRLLVQISGKSQEMLAKELRVSFPAFNAWINGRSIPREAAKLRIEKLLQEYGVASYSSTESDSVKKSAVFDLAKKVKNPLKKIIRRTDLVDELSLRITYNSNAIEGSTLTMEDTASVIFDGRSLSNKTLNEQLEAKNHDRAFRFLLEHVSDRKSVDERLCKKLHSMLLAGIREDAGNYRFHSVRIAGSYVPTANYLKVPELIKNLFKKKIGKDVLASIATFHADFEKIHPFADGNGRVGRLLVIGLLLKNGFAPAIIAKKKRPAYYKALQKAQLDNDYRAIEDFIIDAVIDGYQIVLD